MTLVAVGEMAADVSECGGPQQRVTNCMQQNVGIGVPGEAFCKRDRHAADDQWPAFNKSMHVETFTYSHSLSFRAFSMASASRRSPENVTFRLSVSDSINNGCNPRPSIADDSSVT